VVAGTAIRVLQSERPGEYAAPTPLWENMLPITPTHRSAGRRLARATGLDVMSKVFFHTRFLSAFSKLFPSFFLLSLLPCQRYGLLASMSCSTFTAARAKGERCWNFHALRLLSIISTTLCFTTDKM
jgi:hypothetical protein